MLIANSYSKIRGHFLMRHEPVRPSFFDLFHQITIPMRRVYIEFAEFHIHKNSWTLAVISMCRKYFIFSMCCSSTNRITSLTYCIYAVLLCIKHIQIMCHLFWIINDFSDILSFSIKRKHFISRRLSSSKDKSPMDN